jgi:hypothetical protein
MKATRFSFRDIVLKKTYVAVALTLLVSVLAPVLSSSTASAVGFTTRSLSLSNNTTTASLATTTYSFSVIAPTGANTSLGSVEVDFCTTALYGACATPTGMVVTGAAIGTSSPAGGGTVTSSQTGTPNTNLVSSGTAPQVRFKWGSVQTLTLPQTVTFTFTTMQNPTSAGTFYARVGFFSDTSYTTFTDKGTVAQSVQALQNVSFKVAETLSFCVGSLATGTFAYTTFNAATLGTGCSDTAGTSVSLGTAPGLTTACITPVSTHTSTCNDSSTGSDRYGYAMVQTNAGNGVVIGYRPNNNGSTFQNKTLEIASSTCAAFASANRADGCFNPVNEDAALAIGNVAPFLTTSSTEEFGMSVPRKNTVGRGTTNLNLNTSSTGYGFTGEVTGGTACSTGAAAGQDCWNWHRTGSPTIASSSAGATSAIDWEAIQLMFAAKPSTVTPVGSYQVNIEVYANATF